ncbi:MAG TPA: hemolysin family protein [Ardenticatenaceae bacterium]|nr:hemolysin family protein [Ardenticatenaceae bacterium]
MDVDSSPIIVSAVVLVALLLMALSAAAETAITTIGRSRARALVEAGQPGATTLLQLIENMPRVTGTLAIVNTLALSVIVVAGALLAGPGPRGLWAPLAGLILLTLVVGRTIPAALGGRLSERLAPSLAPVVAVLGVVVAPVRWLLFRIAVWISGPARPNWEDGELTDEELRVLATVVGDTTGEPTIQADEREMIASIFTLRQTTAREVMVPRIDIVGLDVGTPMLEALDTIISAGHSRIPVFEESVDNIIGILYAKDLLAYLRDAKTTIPIRDILRPTHFVPESKKADELLGELQQSRVHIAIVVDEYGGTAGLVTIEDLLEEIVGDIQDEYDVEEPFIELVNEYEAICNARVDLDDLNRAMDLELPTAESDTLGGLIYSELGRVPLVGDTVELPEQGVIFYVLSVAGRRITKVRVVKQRPPTHDEGRSEPARKVEEEEQTEGRVPRAGQAPSSQFGFARLF